MWSVPTRCKLASSIVTNIDGVRFSTTCRHEGEGRTSTILVLLSLFFWFIWNGSKRDRAQTHITAELLAVRSLLVESLRCSLVLSRSELRETIKVVYVSREIVSWRAVMNQHGMHQRERMQSWFSWDVYSIVTVERFREWPRTLVHNSKSRSSQARETDNSSPLEMWSPLLRNPMMSCTHWSQFSCVDNFWKEPMRRKRRSPQPAFVSLSLSASKVEEERCSIQKPSII